MATTTCCVCSFLLVAAIVPSVLGNMPFIHFICTGNATPLLLQKLQASKNSGSSLHVMDVKAMEKTSLRDELRLHARYIRDTLAPILSRQGKLTYTDNVLLRSMFKKLEATSMTLDLLRYSRIEKALMVMAATGARTWPMELVAQAEELIQKWEDELGPLKNLRSDLYGPGGRLEGVRKLTDKKKGSPFEADDESKSAWSVDVLDPLQSYRYGSLGFEVGDWWLKPAAAYRDGIIDRTSHAITADENRAYAIVVNGSRELDMKPNGTFVYHAALDDPGALKLTKTMTSDTEKVVRVLRSWKLRSKLAPKAGLRYDGLYRIESFGIKLLPPKSWHKTFTLSRLPNQPPLSAALAYPMSDQLDDWRDYQRLKHLDRGEDFALLREILRDPTPETNNHDLNGEGDRERHDSGYFSRRSSKLSSRVNSISEAAVEDEDEMGEQGGNSVSSSMLEDIAETELTLVAEGTPSTLASPPRTARPALSTLDGDHSQSFSDPDPDTEFDCSASSTDDEAWTSTPRLRKTATVILIPSPKATDGNASPGKEGEISGAESRADWVEEGGIWMSSNGGLEGVEDREFCDWAARTQDVEEDFSDHPDSVSEASSTDDEAWTTTPRLRKTDTVVHIPTLGAEEGNRGAGMVGEVAGDGCRAEWVEEWGMWRGEDGGLEGVEEREFIDCVGRQGGRKESEGEGVAPEDTVGVGSGRT